MTVIDVRHRFPLAPEWWRGRRRNGAADVTTYAIHYIDDEGTVPGPTATVAEELAYLDAIHRYHINVGYGGFGYHLAAFASGRTYLCTPLDRMGANVLGRNDEVIGVLLVFTGHIIPPLSTRRAAAVAVDYADRTYVGRSPLRPTKGHRELVGTICPGNRFREWVPNLRKVRGMTDEEAARLRAAETGLETLKASVTLVGRNHAQNRAWRAWAAALAAEAGDIQRQALALLTMGKVSSANTGLANLETQLKEGRLLWRVQEMKKRLNLSPTSPQKVTP